MTMERLEKDSNLHDKLGRFAQFISDEDLDSFASIVRNAHWHITAGFLDKDTTVEWTESLEAIPLTNDRNTMFATYRSKDDPRFSVSYFYKESNLMVVFFEESFPVAGGLASCAKNGFEEQVISTYNIVMTILAHPNLNRALGCLAEQCNTHPVYLRDAMIMSFLQLPHPEFPASAKIITPGTMEVTFADLPFGLKLVDGSLKVLDRQSGLNLIKELSVKEVASDAVIRILFPFVLWVRRYV